MKDLGLPLNDSILSQFVNTSEKIRYEKIFFTQQEKRKNAKDKLDSLLKISSLTDEQRQNAINEFNIQIKAILNYKITWRKQILTKITT
jgi:hypothetical protein